MTNEKGAGQGKLPAKRYEADGSVVIQLARPVEWGSETVREIKLARPKGRQLRAIKGEGPDASLRFAASLCEHPDALFDELDVEDVAAVLEAVDGFLPAYLRTGENS